MSIGRSFHCDGPDCDAHTDPIARPAPHLPYGFIEVRRVDPEEEFHFCSWACVMKHAADQPIPEVITMDGIAPEFGSDGDGKG